jgi:hypothetical protein
MSRTLRGGCGDWNGQWCKGFGEGYPHRIVWLDIGEPNRTPVTYERGRAVEKSPNHLGRGDEIKDAAQIGRRLAVEEGLA